MSLPITKVPLRLQRKPNSRHMVTALLVSGLTGEPLTSPMHLRKPCRILTPSLKQNLSAMEKNMWCSHMAVKAFPLLMKLILSGGKVRSYVPAQ